LIYEKLDSVPSYRVIISLEADNGKSYDRSIGQKGD
jgi:hypothetical protein